MQALAAQINVLLIQASTTALFLAPAAATSFGSIHVKDPCQFTGKAFDVEAFLDEIANYIYLQHCQIMTDYKTFPSANPGKFHSGHSRHRFHGEIIVEP